MKLAYQYRLKPTKQQILVIERWLEKLRCQYNYLLADRFNWWQENRCYVNACPLTCSIASPRDKPEYYSQKRSLVTLKQERPWYQEVQSQVLQDMVKRVKHTFDRYISGDSNGKRSGRPRFKGQGRYRTFTFLQIDQNCLDGNYINFPKLGKVKLVKHRQLLEAARIKTASVTRKADGYYLTLAFVVELSQHHQKIEKLGATDLGLIDFLVTDQNESIKTPKYDRASEQRLGEIQKLFSRQKQGSKRWLKTKAKLAKLHLKIARQRKQFFYETWYWLFSKYDAVAHEKLNIKGMSRSNMAKSILDAAWGKFLKIGACVAEKAGKLTIPVKAHRSSTECSSCGEHTAKTLADRWHLCTHCGVMLPRDWNSAIVLKHRAAGHPVLNS